MIRKMLVVAAAVAMPAAALATFTTSGVAGAAKPPPTTGTCTISGVVTFAAPGLSAGGAITNKTVEKSVSNITPTGMCGSTAIKTKIPSSTTECWATPPVYSKTAPVGGTLASGAAASCDVGGTSAAGDATISATTVKTAIKDHLYYDTTGSFASSGTSSIVAALNAKPIKVVNNTNKSVLTVTTANSVLPGGVCGAGIVGFQINGTTTFAGAGNVTITICLTGDGGTGTSGNFLADLLSPTAITSSANIGGLSNITFAP